MGGELSRPLCPGEPGVPGRWGLGTGPGHGLCGPRRWAPPPGSASLGGSGGCRAGERGSRSRLPLGEGPLMSCQTGGETWK